MVKQNFLTKMLLLCALIVGSVSSAWAEEVTLTVSTYATANSWVDATAYSTISINSDLTATCVTGGNNGKYYVKNDSWRHYEGDNGAITITTTSGTLNSITFNYDKNNNGVLIYNSTNYATGNKCDKVSGKTSATFSVGHSSGTKNGNVQITSIVVDYTPSASGLTSSDLSLTNSPIALSFDLYNNSSAQTISYTTSSTGAITVSASDYVTTSVNTTNKTITVTPNNAVTPETQTITVSQAADVTYAAGSVTFTVTITNSDPNVPGTLNNPYTVAQAIAATPSSGTSENVYIKGIVSKFYNTSIVGDGSNYRYYISDDGTETNQLLVYKGKGLNEATFSSANDLLVGDEVVIYGGLTTYSNTKEVAANNHIVSLIRPELVSIALSGEYPTTFHQGDAFSHEGITVTATYENGTTKDVTDDATFSDPDMSTTGTKPVTVSYTENEVTKTATYNITVNAPATLESITLSGEYTTTFTQGDAFDHDGVVVTAHYDDSSTKDVTDDATFSEPDMLTTGTKTVTVSYGGKTATYEITVNKAPAAKRYKKVTEQSEIAEGYNYLIVYDTKAFAGVSSKNIGEKTEVTVSEDDIISNPTGAHVVQFEAATDGNFYIKDGDDYLRGPNSNGLYTTDDVEDVDGTEWTVTPNGITNVSYSSRHLCYNTGSPRFCNYVPSNSIKDVVLYRQFDNVTITAAEYATFCGADALDFNETGIKAFTATDGETSVKLNEITSSKVPANTPVVLYKAGGGTVDVPVVASAEAISGANDLRVSDGTSAAGNGIYVLAKKNGVVGFYPWINTESLSSGKIYLQSASSAPFLGFDGEGTTAIQDIERTINDNQYYTLDGRRVAEPTKGLYIINGKKVVIK